MSPLSVNHNLMAYGVSRQLSAHCDSLADSVRRLSTGLRVERAADDAAGLAIRELMRADIRALGQGARNTNDAISLIQTADGALQIIDEKLIRMKELAEQAATGTYDSTQRLMIDSEFQQMASEIDRIAKATDFNGVKLLDGSLSGRHDGSGAGSEDGLSSTGALKVHFGTANDSAEDYYYVEIGDCTLAGLGLREPNNAAAIALDALAPPVQKNNSTAQVILNVSGVGGHTKPSGIEGYDYYKIPAGTKNVRITYDAAKDVTKHKPHVCLFTKDGTQITGPPAWSFWEIPIDGKPTNEGTFEYWNMFTKDMLEKQMASSGLFNGSYKSGKTIYREGEVFTGNGFTVKMVTDMTKNNGEEVIFIDEVTSDLVFLIGGHDLVYGECNHYSLKIEANADDSAPPAPVDPPDPGGDPNPRPGLPQGDIISIKTQELAQQALNRLDDAIVRKDQVRAHLGATQNRLENTVTNLTVQAESLQAAESRISDVDVATEMTTFVRNQVLTQSATSMLAQANAFPHMLLQLLQG